VVFVRQRMADAAAAKREHASLVLLKIDQILDCEKETEYERDARFVELGRCLCEVRAGRL